MVLCDRLSAGRHTALSTCIMDCKTSAARVEKKRGGRVMERIELLYRKAEQGQAISKTEALFLAEQELGILCAAADSLRKKACGDDFDLCAIINGKSGRCSENCKFCAQSAHYRTCLLYTSRCV